MHLSVLQLEPGDVILLQSAEPVPLREGMAMRQWVEKQFPGHPFCILDCGWRLGVMRGQRAAKEAAGAE